MPIATRDMQGQPGPSSPLSPTSPRTAKAGLFRARSPPADHVQLPILGNLDLNARLDPFGSLNGRFTPESTSSDGHQPLVPPRSGGAGRSVEGGYASSAGASVGHASPLPKLPPHAVRPLSPPHTDASSVHGASTSGHPVNASIENVTDEDRQDEDAETRTIGLTEGHDEMLMTLLAGQAAVDCEQLPIGGWEEVDHWKKVCLSGNPSSHVHQLTNRNCPCYLIDSSPSWLGINEKSKS
jgi:hypothetical protein